VRERRDDGERDQRHGGERAEGGFARTEVVGDLGEQGPDAGDRRAEVRGDQQDGDEQKQARRTSGVRRARFFDDDQ
jgi:hypothetical protein